MYLPWLPFSVYKLITINYQLFFIIFFHLKYPAAGDEVYVCGDSYSDVLGSRRAGTKFIGILTGLEGKKEAALFEREKVPYVDRITEIEKVIDTPSV